jgi:heterodisulfide reductase subunit C
MIEDFLKTTKITRCIQCGKCTASCPAGRHSRLLTRELIYQARLGIDVLGKDELWFCTTCYVCYERCPKGVNTVEAIMELRNRAVREKKYPAIHEVAIKNIHDAGSAFPLMDDVRKMRSMIGLEKDSFGVSTDEEYFKKFRELVEDLPILSLVE